MGLGVGVVNPRTSESDGPRDSSRLTFSLQCSLWRGKPRGTARSEPQNQMDSGSSTVGLMHPWMASLKPRKRVPSGP